MMKKAQVGKQTKKLSDYRKIIPYVKGLSQKLRTCRREMKNYMY